jgi:hypothetical protein
VGLEELKELAVGQAGLDEEEEGLDARAVFLDQA